MKPLIAISISSLWLFGCATSTPRTWEYKTIQGTAPDRNPANSIDTAINREVQQGWEFVTVSQINDNWQMAVMRRKRK